MEDGSAAGTIGWKRAEEAEMKVRDLMSTDVVTTAPATPIRDVANTLVERGISGMPVCDEAGALVGVVSERDILCKELGRLDGRGGLLAWFLDSDAEWVDKARARTAAEAMSAPAITAGPAESAAAAARRMIETGVKRLPVVGLDGRLVGIVTRSDLVRAFVRPDHVIADDIREDVLRKVLWLTPGTVDVQVRDGEVDLAGLLDTEAEVEVLEKLVAKVPGVVTVRSAVTFRREPAATGR